LVITHGQAVQKDLPGKLPPDILPGSLLTILDSFIMPIFILILLHFVVLGYHIRAGCPERHSRETTPDILPDSLLIILDSLLFV